MAHIRKDDVVLRLFGDGDVYVFIQKDGLVFLGENKCTLTNRHTLHDEEHTFLLFNCAKKHVSLHIFPFPQTQTYVSTYTSVLIFILPPGIPAHTYNFRVRKWWVMFYIMYLLIAMNITHNFLWEIAPPASPSCPHGQKQRDPGTPCAGWGWRDWGWPALWCSLGLGSRPRRRRGQLRTDSAGNVWPLLTWLSAPGVCWGPKLCKLADRCLDPKRNKIQSDNFIRLWNNWSCPSANRLIANWWYISLARAPAITHLFQTFRHSKQLLVSKEKEWHASGKLHSDRVCPDFVLV